MTRRPPTKRAKKVGTQSAAKSARIVLFVDAYIANGGNITAAATSAGYSAKTAASQGSRLLTDVKVQSMLAERQAALAQKYELTTENVIKSLAQAVHFDPRRLYKEDGSLKQIAELDDDTAAALSGFEVFEEFAGRGENREMIGLTKKVKWLDKNVARDQAMKHLGLFKADNLQRSPLDGISRDTLKLIQARLRGAS